MSTNSMSNALSLEAMSRFKSAPLFRYENMLILRLYKPHKISLIDFIAAEDIICKGGWNILKGDYLKGYNIGIDKTQKIHDEWMKWARKNNPPKEEKLDVIL